MVRPLYISLCTRVPTYLPTYLPAPPPSALEITCVCPCQVMGWRRSLQFRVNHHTAHTPIANFHDFFCEFFTHIFGGFLWIEKLFYVLYLIIFLYFLRFMPWIRHGNNNFFLSKLQKPRRGQGGRGVLARHAGKIIKNNNNNNRDAAKFSYLSPKLPQLRKLKNKLYFGLQVLRG